MISINTPQLTGMSMQLQMYQQLNCIWNDNIRLHYYFIYHVPFKTCKRSGWVFFKLAGCMVGDRDIWWGPWELEGHWKHVLVIKRALIIFACWGVRSGVGYLRPQVPWNIALLMLLVENLMLLNQLTIIMPTYSLKYLYKLEYLLGHIYWSIEQTNMPGRKFWSGCQFVLYFCWWL